VWDVLYFAMTSYVMLASC